MKILALTHAHLTPEGLSPVSCERADSVVWVWGEKMNWEVDVVHTRDTQWRGIWPGGKGLKVNIIEAAAPPELFIGAQELFSQTFKRLLRERNIGGLTNLLAKRITKRLRGWLANKGMALPMELAKAEKWGQRLYDLKEIHNKKYDFIFACVGFGDEYLLQTALTLSEKLHTKMIVDFRDLWSQHHEAERFTEKQRELVRKHEVRLLRNTVLLSVPQKPMVAQLNEYLDIPVYTLTHSAHIEASWGDGHVVSDEFRMLYAGKIYAGNPGLTMLLEMLQKLAREKTGRPVRCHFYIDDADALKMLIAGMDIDDSVVIHGWVSPAAIWKEMRSAHLLLLFDGGFYKQVPLIMTKTYQYAQSGRPILALAKYGNTSYEEVLAKFNAGVVCETVDEAVAWVKNLAADETQYHTMPPMKKVPTRSEIALAFSQYIENLLGAKTK